jgi:hypothetical protein
MGAPTSTVHSACECQAVLFATLNPQHLVLRSWAVLGVRAEALAYSVHPEARPFDLVWTCPFCSRNSLRSFEPAALRWDVLAASGEAPGP